MKEQIHWYAIYNFLTQNKYMEILANKCKANRSQKKVILI